MYVLDTNTLIYFFKGSGNVAKHLLAVPPQEIAIPTIVLFELEFGIAKSTSPRKRQAQLKDMISAVNIFQFGYKEAKSAASIRMKLEQKGRLIGPYDLLIAAVALSNDSTLVTHNTSEFQRVEGLKVIDWF
jgi:tRNA(fMet)-specific endonuclease VapC